MAPPYDQSTHISHNHVNRPGVFGGSRWHDLSASMSTVPAPEMNAIGAQFMAQERSLQEQRVALQLGASREGPGGAS